MFSQTDIFVQHGFKLAGTRQLQLELQRAEPVQPEDGGQQGPTYQTVNGVVAERGALLPWPAVARTADRQPERRQGSALPAGQPLSVADPGALRSQVLLEAGRGSSVIVRPAGFGPRGFFISGGSLMRIRVVPLMAVALLVSGLATAQTAQLNQARSRAMPQYKLGLEDLRAERWTRRRSHFNAPSRSTRPSRWPYYALGRATAPQKKYAEAVAALTKCRDLYREQAGRQFSNQQEAQQYPRDQLKEIDEVIRQYQSGPQTAQTSRGGPPVDRAPPPDAGEPAARYDVSIEASVPSFVSLALGSAFSAWGSMRSANTKRPSPPIRRPAKRTAISPSSTCSGRRRGREGGKERGEGRFQGESDAERGYRSEEEGRTVAFSSQLSAFSAYSGFQWSPGQLGRRTSEEIGNSADS